MRTAFVLRMVLGIVTTVGIVICLLAFYILMLSIYLLIQKNSSKLEYLKVTDSPNQNTNQPCLPFKYAYSPSSIQNSMKISYCPKMNWAYTAMGMVNDA